MTAPKIDNTGETLSIDQTTGIVRIDGIIVCKAMIIGDKLILQFKDGDKLRSRYRGTCFVEIPLSVFVSQTAELLT